MAFNKFKKLLGDTGDDIGEPVDPEENGYNIDNGKNMSDNNRSSNSNNVSEPSNQMILIEPRAYSESQSIADYLKSKNTVVVNLKRVTANQAKRIIDFLTGTLYAIGGDLQKIGPGIYLCTPKDVKVQGKISDDDKPKEAKEEEVDW